MSEALLLFYTTNKSPVRLVGPGHRIFIPATGVRIPYGTPVYGLFYTLFKALKNTSKYIKNVPVAFLFKKIQKRYPMHF